MARTDASLPIIPRLLSAVAAALCCAFFSGCGLEIKPAPDTLRRWISAEPDTLNPILASDAYASLIDGYVNDSLIDRDPDTLEFVPELATRWEISPDHLQYTFYLREGVTWHDGKPFTADDVLYSFEKIKDPSVQAPFLRVYYADVLRVEKLGPFKIRFIYSKPYFMGLSVCGGMPLLPKHVFDDGSDFNQHPAARSPVGTGPYRFVSWQTNKKIVLERNENYWGAKPQIRRQEMVVVGDDTVALQVLKKGELDLSAMRPIQWIRQTNSEKFNSQFHRLKYLMPGYNYIGWNLKSLFFSDKRVRQAMTHLVDRQKILEKLKFGLGKTVEGPFFIETATYDKSLVPYGYNPARAKALLTEAGWADTDGDGILDKDGRPFIFEFLYPAAAKDTERLATILKEDLKKIGVEMNLVRLEWAAFINKIEKKEFEATSLAWSTSFEQDPFQLWHSSQAEADRGSNFVSFKNKEVDRIIESARVEFNTDKRNALYQEMQKIIYEEQPYTFLFSSYSLVAASKRFDNITVHKAGLDILEWGISRPKAE